VIWCVQLKAGSTDANLVIIKLIKSSLDSLNIVVVYRI
jgi:hypothetical protein